MAAALKTHTLGCDMKKNNTFTNQVVVITGSARGIGKTIAYEFGLRGARIVLCDVNQKAGKETLREFSKKQIQGSFISVDLGHKGTVRELIEKVVKKHGKIDILINNAKSGEKTNLFTETEETWEKGINVTLKAAFFASQAAVVAMRKTGGGSIVNISSVEAVLAGVDSPVYHIAKAGMLQMTRYLAVNSGKYQVRVNAILPGFIVQDEHQKKYLSASNAWYRDIAQFIHPGGKIGNSQDIAEAALFLCSPQAEFITGQLLTVDGGLTIQEQSGLLYRFEKEKK